MLCNPPGDFTFSAKGRLTVIYQEKDYIFLTTLLPVLKVSEVLGTRDVRVLVVVYYFALSFL